MSDSPSDWRDLTVDDAIAVSDFYVAVLGWQKEPLSMGEYDDFIVKDADGRVMGGICHRKGANEAVPAGWIPYFTTTAFDTAVSQVAELGGKLLTDVREHGSARFVYVSDPGGACFALYSGG